MTLGEDVCNYLILIFSVVGLNFDFLSLNIVGFVLYSLFNCGLFWITEVEVSLILYNIFSPKKRRIVCFIC